MFLIEDSPCRFVSLVARAKFADVYTILSPASTHDAYSAARILGSLGTTPKICFTW